MLPNQVWPWQQVLVVGAPVGRALVVGAVVVRVLVVGAPVVRVLAVLAALAVRVLVVRALVVGAVKDIKLLTTLKCLSNSMQLNHLHVHRSG
jgi:hypothetical protein